MRKLLADALSQVREEITTWEELRSNPFAYFALAIATALLTSTVLGPTIAASGMSVFWKTQCICWLGVFMLASILMGVWRLRRWGR